MEMYIFRGCLVYQLKNMFLIFKQYYKYFYTLVYSHVFKKKNENCCLNIRTKQALVFPNNNHIHSQMAIKQKCI